MSVLRRVKLRTPDGIESIEYPLGVDVENVEVANQENLSQRLVRIDEDLEKNEEDIAAVSELAGANRQNIGANEIRIDALERSSASIDKKPYYFDTVADMKAYPGLKEGDMVITLGYSSINDGGNSYYKIRNITNEDVIDETNIIALSNQILVAELLNPTYIDPEHFYGENDTEKLQNTINYACDLINNNIPTCIEFNRLFTVTNSLLINFNMNRIPLKIYSNGKGGILVNCNNLFITTKNYVSDLIFENITFIGNSGSNNLIMTSPKFINVNFLNCVFKNIDKCVNSETYIQAFKFLNCLITGGNGNFIECYGAYFINIENCTIEHRRGFVFYQNSSTDIIYNRIYFANFINNLIEGITNENSGVFRFCRITKCNILNNYFESNIRNILIDCASVSGNLTVNNNRCFFGTSVPKENNGFLFINPDIIHAFSIPKISMENNVVENSYLIYFKNDNYLIDTIYNGNSSLTLLNNRVSNAFSSEFYMNGELTNPLFNVFPLGKTNNLMNRNQPFICNEKFNIRTSIEKENKAYDISIIFNNGSLYIRSSATFNLSNDVQNCKMFFRNRFI